MSHFGRSPVKDEWTLDTTGGKGSSQTANGVRLTVGSRVCRSIAAASASGAFRPSFSSQTQRGPDNIPAPLGKVEGCLIHHHRKRAVQPGRRSHQLKKSGFQRVSAEVFQSGFFYYIQGGLMFDSVAYPPLAVIRRQVMKLTFFCSFFLISVFDSTSEKYKSPDSHPLSTYS